MDERRPMDEQPGQWLVVTVRCASAAADTVRDRLLDMSGGRGTAEEELGDTVLISAYAPLECDWIATVADLADQLAALRPFFGDGMVGAPVAQLISEEDWAESWKRHYEPMIIGRLVIKPTWLGLPDDAPADGVVVQLDPQMAFGTGTHATTRLTLLALQRMLAPGQTLADVGTGSGIISIAAALLGAGKVYATDNDPVAVHAAEANASANAVADRVQVMEGEYLAGVPLAQDGILANISPGAIMELAPAAHDHLKPGGYLVASGFTTRSADEVAEAVKAAGIEVLDRQVEGEWVCLIGRRSG